MFVPIFLEGFGGKQNKQESQSNAGRLFSLLTSAQTLPVAGVEQPPGAARTHRSLQQLVTPIVLLTVAFVTERTTSTFRKGAIHQDTPLKCSSALSRNFR